MNETEKIDWHPAFTAAMKLELKQYSEYLEYIEEYQLTEKPLRIDVIILNKDDIKIEKNIASIFRKYNVMEYKSPTDYLSIDDFYKTLAYAYLFKGIESQKQGGIDKVKINELTTSLVSLKYPRKLINHLNEKGLNVIKKSKGIYYVENVYIPTQILVQSELSDVENEYLKLLTNQLEEKSLLEKVMSEYEDDVKNLAYTILLSVVLLANQNISMEVINMRLTEKNQVLFEDMVKRIGLDEKIKNEGRKESAIEIAKKMLRRGTSVNIVAEDTELSIEEIENIKKDISN